MLGHNLIGRGVLSPSFTFSKVSPSSKMRTNFTIKQTKPKSNSYEQGFLVNPSSRQLASCCVSAFQLPVRTNYTKEAWAQEFDEEVPDEAWNESPKRIQVDSV